MKMVDSFEKIPLEIFPNATTGSAFVAKKIARLIREKEKNKERCVLGLSTGKSPLKLYTELIRMHKEEGLSFKNVVAFNLDEYYPIQRTARQSYYRFMKENLFDQIDIDYKSWASVPTDILDLMNRVPVVFPKQGLRHSKIQPDYQTQTTLTALHRYRGCR